MGINCSYAVVPGMIVNKECRKLRIRLVSLISIVNFKSCNEVSIYVKQR